MTVAFNKFNSFSEAICEKIHNLGSDSLKIALTNTAPTASNTQLSNITEISYTNCSARTITTTSSSQTSGVYKLVLADLTLTASGGSVATFRYVVLYNDTATNDELIGWWDYGSAVTLVDTQQFIIDFDASAGVLTVT